MVEPSTPDPIKRLRTLVRTAIPLVGRREELAWFARILPEALAGGPRVVPPPGEAGSGKTRLLHEVRAGALRRGFELGYSRGYEHLTLPYLPCLEVSHTLLGCLFYDRERLVCSDSENHALVQGLSLRACRSPVVAAPQPTWDAQPWGTAHRLATGHRLGVATNSATLMVADRFSSPIGELP
jgi:hypothetical protein